MTGFVLVVFVFQGQVLALDTYNTKQQCEQAGYSSGASDVKSNFAAIRFLCIPRAGKLSKEPSK